MRQTLLRTVACVLLLLALGVVSLAARAAPDGFRPDSRSVTAVRIYEPILIDGRLDEPAWERAEPARDFYQQQPREGAVASEPSAVRFLFDDDTLYVGGVFSDSDPRGGITNELKRDFSARDGDLITIVLDTFRDRRNATNFMINPAGAQRDSQSYDDGRQNNADWDGVWRVRTARVPGGWSMEMAIPFKTLKFPDADEQVWGLNVMRLVRRKNEVAMWSPIPRQFNQFKVSYAGVLNGIRGIKPGRSLRVKPFVTSQVSHPRHRDAARPWEGDGGVDVKYGVGTAMTLDLTWRTDFSQVEADEQQINLTRFNLFLPEKRDFFLENQGTFRIGDIDLQTAVRSPVVPFFSRRIGLALDGSLIPIVGGARLTGKRGGYSVGMLNVQTEAIGGRAAANFTAARVTREMGAQSGVSLFYLGRESGSSGGNRVAGADLHLNFRRVMDTDVFLMVSDTTGRSPGVAGRGALNVKTDRYTAHGSYSNVGRTFQNDLGFIPRGDIGLASWEFTRYFRQPASSRWLRFFSLGTDGDAYSDSAHEGLLTRIARATAAAEFVDGGTAGFTVSHDREVLRAPFEIRPGITIAPGEYAFAQAGPTVATAKSRAVSATATYQRGGFWSGTVRTLDSSLRVRVNERFAATAGFARSDVSLPQGRFTADLVRLRADYSFSTTMFLNAFTQYNGATSAWLTNIRYRYQYRPLSDIYVVYNESRARAARPQRGFIVKYSLLLAF